KDESTPNDEGRLQVREASRNAEERDGNGADHQVHKGSANDRQRPDPDQLAKRNSRPRGGASRRGCHTFLLSHVSNFCNTIRRLSIWLKEKPRSQPGERAPSATTSQERFADSCMSKRRKS